MTDRQKFHETFDALQAPDGLLDVVLAQTAAPWRRKCRPVVRIALIAACLAVLLTITILADTPAALVSESNAREVFYGEWQALHDLGVVTGTLDEDIWTCWQEWQVDHFLFFHWKVDPNFYFTYKGEDYYARVSLDPDSGKITDLLIEAYNTLAEPDWEPVKCFTNTFTPEPQSIWEKVVDWVETKFFHKEPPEPRSVTFTYYDHYEVLFNKDLTAGEFGEIWCDYAGYDSFEVLETDPDALIYNARTPLEGDVYFAFQKTTDLQPAYIRFSYGSTAISMAIHLTEVSEENQFQSHDGAL